MWTIQKTFGRQANFMSYGFIDNRERFFSFKWITVRVLFFSVKWSLSWYRNVGYLSFSFLFNVSLVFTDSGLFRFLTVLSEIKSVENGPLRALIFGDTVEVRKEVTENLCCVCLLPEQRMNKIFSSILVWQKLCLIQALEFDYVLSKLE